MKVALCQLSIMWEDKEETMKKAVSFMNEAKREKADIVFFPEMTLTGFSMQTLKTMDRKYGETIERFQNTCKEIGIAAGFGWVEGTEREKAKNHYSIVDDGGVLLSDYVKIHPFGYGGEGKHFQGGNKIVSCRYKEHIISTAICYDLRFPELFRIMDENCSLVVIPANWPASRREHWNCLLKARAIENQVYVAGVNCAGEMDGQYYSGDSVLLNPLGEELASITGKEGMIYYDILNDVEQYRRIFPVQKDRKIEIRKLSDDNN